jgi:hypothetical protein
MNGIVQNVTQWDVANTQDVFIQRQQYIMIIKLHQKKMRMTEQDNAST